MTKERGRKLTGLLYIPCSFNQYSTDFIFDEAGMEELEKVGFECREGNWWSEVVTLGAGFNTIAYSILKVS